MKSQSYTIQGVRPLLMHNGQLADPANPYSQLLKPLMAKKAKQRTDADNAEIMRLQWTGALYWDDAVGGPVIPDEIMLRAIQDGAAKERNGKKVAASCIVAELNIPIILPAHVPKPTSMAHMYSLREHYVFRKIVRIPPKTGARQPCERPIIPTGWKATFTVEYDERQIDQKDIHAAIQAAGALVGIGVWRPKFGRFILV